EQHLRAVVVERRRVPEREVRVRNGADAHRVRRIRDVEEQPIAAARTAAAADRGEYGDVMTLRRTRAHGRRALALRRITTSTLGALEAVLDYALPNRRRGSEVWEDARSTDDLRLLGMGERHLDHFDAEEL